MDDPFKQGVILIIVGVLANNYVYLHDLIMDTNQGYIQLGAKSTAAIIISLVIIAAGLWRTTGTQGDSAA